MPDGMRSHVHKGQSVVTGSTPKSDFPRDYPLATTASLKAPRTRRASPLLAGLSLGSLPARANQLPDKEFRLSSYSDMSSVDISERNHTPFRCDSLHVAMQMGPSHHPQALRASGVWSLRIPVQIERAFPADCPHPTHCHCRRIAGE